MAGTLPPILVELKASSSEFMAKMGAARAEVTKLGTGGSANLAKFAAIGKVALLGTAVAAVGIGIASVKMASDFQSSMELIRTQAGASQGEVDRMSKSVLSLAGKTATAPDELAKGLYHLESSGLRGAKALDALKYAAEGAKVGHADLESVTNALNAVIASGIKGASNMAGAMGALNATVGAGDMRMQDLADAMGTGVLTVAKNFGVSLNDVGAALAVFGDNNIRGADAATKLSQAITYMEKPAASAGKVFKTFGMTTKELRVDIGKGGLGLALKDLHEHLTKAGITGTKVGPVLLDAFGRKPAGAINTLLGQFQRFQSKQEEVRRGAKGFGDDWTATTKTFSFQVEQLKTQLEVLGVKIGTALIPRVRELATVVMDVVQWFEKHTTVAKLLGIAIGTVLVVAVMAYTVAMAQAAVETIAATWPILAIIAAVALLGVGIYELATHWHQVWGAISSFVRRVGGDIIREIRQWGPLALAVLVPMFGIPLLIWQHFSAIKGLLSRAFTDALGAIKRVVGDVIGFVKSIPGKIVGALGDLSGLLVHAGEQIIGGLISGIKNTAANGLTSVLHHVTDLIPKLKGPPAKDAKLLYPAGVLIIDGLVRGINDRSGHLVIALKHLTRRILEVTFPGGKAAMQGLIDGLKSRESALKTKLDNLVQRLNTVRDAAKQMSDSISSGLTQSAGLANIPQITNADGTSSADSSVAGASAFMQAQLAQLKQFYADLATDKDKGLSATLLQQLASMGADKGGALAASIAGGSSGDVANLNKLQAGIDATSASVGQLVANATYGDQIAALSKKVDAAEMSYKSIDKLAKAIEVALKHEKPLKVHLYIDGKELAVEVRKELLKTKARNGATGL